MTNTRLDYVWLDGKESLRSKTKYFPGKIQYLEDIPEWNYDGSSTYQAFTEQSEVNLFPISYYSYNYLHLIVLCKTDHTDCTISEAEQIFEEYKQEEPLFGIEQEFFIYDLKTNLPLGWPTQGEPKVQGDYYCSVGADVAYGREFIEECLSLLTQLRIRITGFNYEVAPGQAEIQICDYGIEAANSLIILRYILCLVGEKYGYVINFHPKPIEGNWNGSGCHVNFSTLKMRSKNGYDEILRCMDRLDQHHHVDILRYGKDNHKRLTGKHETSSLTDFSYGVANRGASVRIPTQTFKEKQGYFEDRRPASNMNPYIVTSLILKRCVE